MNIFEVSGRVACACLLFVALVTGCDIPERPRLEPADSSQAIFSESNPDAFASPVPERLETPREPLRGGWETWDAYFIDGEHVGYAHMEAESIGDTESGDVRYALESRLYAGQGNARILHRLLQTSTETSEGELVSFEGVQYLGPVVTQNRGALIDGNLEIETTRGSSRTTRRVPWQKSFRGLVAVEQSLRQSPMTKKGEQRSLKVLLPGQYQLATARLHCTGDAYVPLMDGTLGKLLEINIEIQLEKQRTYSAIWTDESGKIVRTFSPALKLVAFRTDESTATDFSKVDSVASISVGGKIAQPSQATSVAFQITSIAAKHSGSAIDFKAGPGQFVRKSTEGAFQVIVTRQSNQKAPNGFQTFPLAPGDADLQPNHFIDSGSTLVRRFADAAVGASTASQREIAVALTRTANQVINDHPDAGGFTKGSEVAGEALGDATERAVLLAAMLRSRKIPARLAIGLKYSDAARSDDRNRMVYHVWTLAHVEGGWIHLDATEGNLAAADRLIFSTTDLSGGDEYRAQKPLLAIIGNVEIDIVGQK